MAFGSATTSSDAIARRFAALEARKRRALVPYCTAGHPSVDASVALIHALEAGGADIIEVGVPFSDPIADGPVIQGSSQRALEQGMTLDRTLELIARASPKCPVVLFTYLNPLLSAGDDVLQRAADAGVHGVLVTDLPVGSDAAREAWLGESPLAFIRLVAPTTPVARMREIARHGSGFVYLISRLGVTGMQAALSADLGASTRRLREATTLPVCVGFGISTPEQAAAAARLADGVVVGSAIVQAVDAGGVDAAARLAASMRAAIDAV